MIGARAAKALRQLVDGPRSDHRIRGAGPKTLAALTKAGAKADIRPGDYSVDFAVRVRGVIRKGEASQYRPTVAIPHKRAMAFLCQFVGLAGSAAMEQIAKAMRAALAAGEECDLAVVEQAELDVASALEQMPLVEREGPVSVLALTVERIALPEA